MLGGGKVTAPWCREKVNTWFIPGEAPNMIGSVYYQVVLDIKSGDIVWPPYDPVQISTEVSEFWPSKLANVFAQAGLPRRAAYHFAAQAH